MCQFWSLAALLLADISPRRSQWALKASGLGPHGYFRRSIKATCIRSIQRKLIEAGSGDTVITRSESGKTFRQIRTGWSQAWEAEGAPSPLKMPYQDVLVGDLLGAIEEHDIEPLIHSGAGQSVGYFDQVRPVRDILNALRDDAIQAINGQTRFVRA